MSRGRRSAAWRKHKHRRAEWLTVTGWTPADPGARNGPALHVARRAADGELISPGAVQLGLHSDAAARRRGLLDTLPPATRRPTHRLAVPPAIAVQVDFHGPPGGRAGCAI